MKNAVRYASQTTGVNFEKVLTWGAIAGGAWLALRVISFYSGVTDKVAGAVANAYVNLTTDPVETAFRFVLPDGRKILGNLVKVVDAQNNVISYGGARYKVTTRRPDGDYNTVRA
jgi:hypothetical protein